MRPVDVAGVILAAGFSRRLGRPKQEVQLGDATLLLRAARTALAAGLHPVLAVVRDRSWELSLQAMGVMLVLNTEAQEGMASSVRAGIGALEASEVEGLVLMTCDQPLLRPGHLQQLCAKRDQVTGSAYRGRTGVPAFFPPHTWGALLALTGDTGARVLLENAPFVQDESLALDIDTEEDLQRALQVFGDQDS